ncbi:5885_t:CDS:2 [Dentiscutata heterogama]|uniref:5885_t:CDS:1 n=1 Tax=Dentiscutata heterogama TaxID=1316150 RepID=A0ACA9KJR1_9GLOM|nr:5885_t:CDS:2 [Dentiscutata heterogama]
MSNTSSYINVNLVLIGDVATGKSSLVIRYINDEFQENKEPTIGAAFLTTKCRCKDAVIKFEIWDTAGLERFHLLTSKYYRNALAAIVVYDVTKAVSWNLKLHLKYTTLLNAKSWVKELHHNASPNIIIALVGNKIDLVQSLEKDIETGRQVPTEEAKAYALEAGPSAYECKPISSIIILSTKFGPV